MPKLFVPTPNTVEVTWETFGYDHVNTCNVVHFLNQNPPTTSDQVDEFIGNLSAWYGLNVMPFLSVDWIFDTATCRPIDAPDLFQTIDHAHIVTGGSAGRALPNHNAFRIEMITALPGKAGRGHRKMGGIPENQVEGNRVSAYFALGMQAAWDSLLPLSDGLGWTWCVLSKSIDGTPRTEGLMTPITSVVVLDQVIDTCRSRIRRVI